jgi:hypothetical protein
VEVSNEGGKYIKRMWENSKFFSKRKFPAYFFFVYELYHHWNDIYYIFYMPHWNWGVALLLLISFWGPLVLAIGIVQFSFILIFLRWICYYGRSGGIPEIVY